MRTGRPKQPLTLEPGDKAKLELLARRRRRHSVRHCGRRSFCGRLKDSPIRTLRGGWALREALLASGVSALGSEEWKV